METREYNKLCNQRREQCEMEKIRAYKEMKKEDLDYRRKRDKKRDKKREENEMLMTDASKAPTPEIREYILSEQRRILAARRRLGANSDDLESSE